MPPMTKVTMKPIDHNTGTVNRTRPPYIVNSQLKIFTPVGTAMIMLMMPKKALTSALAPMVKKWCSQTMKERTQIDHGRGDHRAVAEQRLAGEGRDDLGKDAERRQDQDVDLRMTPDPEQVHVHHRVAAGVDREEVEAEITVEQQHREVAVRTGKAATMSRLEASEVQQNTGMRI